MSDLISSSANPLVRRIRQLAERRYRRREGCFVVEGLQPVWQVVESPLTIEQFVIAPDLLVSEPAQRLIAEQEARGVPVARLSSTLFHSLSGRDGSTGLAAIVRMQTTPLDTLMLRPDAPLVVLHEIGNPGNLGTILRTADAAGAGGVILLDNATDPFAPEAVKASMGALFHLLPAQTSSSEFLEWAQEHDLALVTTSAHAANDYWQSTYPQPLALLFGNEGRGLPADLLQRGTLQVRIPMFGTARSLNLAVATGIMLYEVRRSWAAST